MQTCKRCGGQVDHNPRSTVCTKCSSVNTKFTRKLSQRDDGLTVGSSYQDAIAKAKQYWPYLKHC